MNSVLSQILAALIWNPGALAALVQWAPSQEMGLCHETEILFFSAAALSLNFYKIQEGVILWTDLKIYSKSGIQDSWKNWYPVDLCTRCASSNLLTTPVTSLEEVAVGD